MAKTKKRSLIGWIAYKSSFLFLMAKSASVAVYHLYRLCCQRRIHVIEFPRKFAEHEMDVELTEKLMAELSGIFNWALEGYKRLGGQKFIFSESPVNVQI